LDYAAATPMDPMVLEAMQPYFEEQFYNPSATYLSAKAVKSQLEAARAKVARLIGARPAEIIFTSGATEANNLAIQGIMKQFPGYEMLTSSIEHQSVLAPAKLFTSQEIPVDKHGIILLNKLSNLINDKTVLVSIMLVNNELGTVQPLREVSKILDSIRQQRLAANNKTPLYLHSDAAQAGNYFDLHVSRLGVDLLSINGGKLYGPKQSGLLYVKAGTMIQPLIVGGGQEFGLRSGTENVAGCIGLAAAFELAQAGRHTEAVRVRQLRDSFESNLTKLVSNPNLNGSVKYRSPHISSVTFIGTDNERLMMELDELGIECAVGSACSASNEEPSHVLKSIGLSAVDINSTLRFSFGKNTSAKDVNVVSDALGGVITS